MSQIYLRVNIEDNFKPLDIDNLRREIENLVGVIEVYPCVEAAQQITASDVTTYRGYCENHKTHYEIKLGCPACPPRA